MINDRDLEFFAELTRATVHACRVEPGEKAGDKTNLLDFSAICPGGRGCYPAVWIQDFTMIYASGFVPFPEGLSHLKLILACQNGDEPVILDSNAVVPPHAIADHIDLDGSPSFFPGTYSSGSDQGGEPYGLRPPVNNHYDVIWLAFMLSRDGDPGGVLLAEIGGRSVYERLKNAFHAPAVDPDTGLVQVVEESRAVGFIFCDIVYMTGHLLMASLLRRRAAVHLAVMATELGRDDEARGFLAERELIEAHVVPVFSDESGWLRASTGISSQFDVWGTAYAVHSGALPAERGDEATTAIADAVTNGQIEFEGAYRHIPLNADFSEKTAWERCTAEKNRYMNGAYWHVPAGWVTSALRLRYPQLASELWAKFIAHMRANAFTKGGDLGAPWECIGWDHKADQHALFGPAVTMPYHVLCQSLSDAEFLPPP